MEIYDRSTRERLGILDLGMRNSGEFAFLSGRKFAFKQVPWKSTWNVVDQLGVVQVTLSQRSISSKVRVVIGSRLGSRTELPVLIAASRFAMFVIRQETGASTGSRA